MGILSKGVSKYAYRDKLTCPWMVNDQGQRDLIRGDKACGSSSWKFVEEITPLRIRYRCRKCGGTVQYDISNRTDLNPYAPYQKSKMWGNIQKVLQGRQLKGALK